MLELNDVLLKGERWTVTMMAAEGQLTCITSGCQWLYAMMGIEEVVNGFISIDGEPLTPHTAPLLRRMMAFVPSSLEDIGELMVYDAPTPHDVFSLRHNRSHGLSDDALADEMARTGVTGQQARLLATAVLLKRPILLVDNPSPSSAHYLQKQAQAGTTVIVTTKDEEIISYADNVVDVGWLES